MTLASERHLAILLRVMASALVAFACYFAVVALVGCATTQKIRRARWKHRVLDYLWCRSRLEYLLREGKEWSVMPDPLNAPILERHYPST
jgi:hypothetical protein